MPQVARRRNRDLPSLDRLDDERGDVPLAQLGLEPLEVTERHALASGQQRPEALLEELVADERQGPSVTPWKLESHEIKRGRPVAARANFIAESTASAPVLQKNTESSPAGRRCDSASASIPASTE